MSFVVKKTLNQRIPIYSFIKVTGIVGHYIFSHSCPENQNKQDEAPSDKKGNNFFR